VLAEGAVPGLSRAGLLVLCATILVSVISASMATVALPNLQADFGIGADDLTWVVTAYLIPFATGTVIYGRLADMYGTKPMYVVGLSLFVAASLFIAAAPSFPLVVAGRALQGFGGTAVPSLSLTTIVRTTPPAERGGAMGMTIVAVGVGFALGPLAGGALTEWWGWRGPFLATGLATAPLLPLALRVVPPVRGTAGQSFDVFGAAMLTAAITGDILALNRLPRHPGDLAGLVGLCLSAPLWLTFVFWVRRRAQPFIEPAVVANTRFVALCGIGAASQGVHFATIVLIPLLLARYHDMGVMEIGLHLLPGALALAAFGLAGGTLSARLGTRTLVVTGTAVQVAGALLFHLAGFSSGSWAISAVYVVVASGYGMVNGSVINAATAELPERLAGLGVGVFNLAFFLGGAVSVAISGAILRARESAPDPFNVLLSGSAPEFSDAFIVVAAFALTAFSLALATSRQAQQGAPR
jgi:DHA2 family metal-tetracycline-proton antiporter-like MFS transporter